LTAENNEATSFSGNGIAGNQVNIGNATNSFGKLNLDARNNSAYSFSGDAVASNDINIGYNTDSNF